MKTIITKSLLFFLIVGVIIAFLGDVLLPKRPFNIASENLHSEHESFYELDKNSLDILFLGSSHAYASVSPEDIYNDYGMTGYIQSSSCQKIWQSYFYLKECLYTQKPKVVVLDVFKATESFEQTEPYNHEAIDNMRLSPVKMEAAYTAYKMNPDNEDFLSYIFPVFRYHDRWKELSKDDIYYYSAPRNAVAKGFAPLMGAVPTEFNIQDYTCDIDQNLKMDYTCENYMNNIKKLCDENDISLVLVKYPTCLWSKQLFSVVNHWASENHVPYLDFNADETLRSEVAIDWNVDTLDGGNHLNYSGALKTTDWLGRWLKQNYSFEDRRLDSSYDSWAQDYKNYKKCVLNYELSHCSNYEEYVKKLKQNQYIVLMNINNPDIGNSETAICLLKELGIDENYLNNAMNTPNLLIMNSGDIIFKETNGEMVNFREKIEGFDLRIIDTFDGENRFFACIYDKANIHKDYSGIEFIVFDPLTQKQVDTSCWGIDEDFMIARQDSIE